MPGTPWHTPGMHAGAAPRDIAAARVVGGSRTAPTVQPGTPQHVPGCTPVPRRATSWTHGSWAVHEPPLRSGLARRSMCQDARRCRAAATSPTHGSWAVHEPPLRAGLARRSIRREYTQVPRCATSPTHGSWAVHEPPLRAGLAHRRIRRGCTPVARAARDPGRTGRGRFTNRPYGPAWHAVAYAGTHAGVAPRGISDARVVGGSRTAPTGRSGTPQHTPGMHAGVALRDIPDARVVGGSRTAPAGRPGPIPLASPAPCCTITPVAFTDPLHSLTYCYA